MKKIFLPFLLLCSFCFSTLHGQQLDRVQGNILIRLLPNENLDNWVKTWQYFEGKPTQLKIDEQVSSPLTIWLLSFDHTQINEYTFLENIRKSPAVQAVIILWAIFQALNLLEVNVTALIAGVSIGGLAIALAAQDTVKNLIGSAMIFVDKPFQIGDFIDLGGFAGTVEEVGFRTTRIRKSDSSIVAVPNGVIANQAITNLGVRVYRLFQTQLGVVYGTSPEAIQLFTDSLKQLIEAHPNTQKEGYYVHLTTLADSSLGIMFRVALDVPDYATELKVKEQLLLSILRIANTLGISFAFPCTLLN